METVARDVLIRSGTGPVRRLRQAPPAGPIFTAWPWERRVGRSRPKPYDELLGDYQSWVYACVRVISNRVSAIPTEVMAEILRDGRPALEEISDHPLSDLLKKPNPFMPRAFFFNLTQVHLDLTGNAYWFKVRDRLGVTRELWPLLPDRMRIVPDAEKFLGGYLYRVKAQDLAFAPEDVVHIKYPHPSNLWYGLGPVEAMAYEVDADLYMRIYQKLTFENDATPSGLLTTTQYISEADAERLRARWYERYGGVTNRAKVAILHSGLDFKPVTVSPKDLEFLNQARINRDKLLSAFGVPASKIGLVEDVNRANAEANDVTFNQEAIAPRLILRDEFITVQLAHDFDRRLSVVSDDPVPRNREADRADHQAYLQSAVMTINEVRTELGKGPVPWGNEGYLPFNVVPVGMAGAGPGYTEMEAPPGEEVSGESALTPASPLMGEGETGLETRASGRDRIWNRFASFAGSHERRFAKIVQGLFLRQRREVLKRLKRALASRIGPEDAPRIEAILFDERGAFRIFDNVGEKFIQDMIVARGNIELTSLGIEAEFDGGRRPIIELISQMGTKFAREVNGTTRRQLRHSLLEGINGGETIRELAGRVESIYDHATGYRAVRIARTVTIGASNAGAVEAYKQGGIEEHQWLSARDERVRRPPKSPYSHAIDGEKVTVGARFSNGLRYPGDPRGAAGNIINCRCTVAPVVKSGEESNA